MALTFQAKLLLSATGTINFIISMRGLLGKQLAFERFGDPLKVLRMVEYKLPPLNSEDVLVRMLAAPVNPADINTIQGKYPVKVKFPSVAGNEGVGIVEEIGEEVQNITKGNKVIVSKPGLGTWRTFAVFKYHDLTKVPERLGVAEAATLTVNACTAYRMLTDFKPVRQHRLVVMQNGANGTCGQYVIQLCRCWCLPNVNIVRKRPEINELKQYLECLGATYVLTEEELRSTTIFKNCVERPVLALNCVGGKSSRQMVKYMNHSGTMVTFGGMSKKPVTVPTPAFIFKNISLFGFWMTAWHKSADKSDKDEMLTEIINLMCEGKLKAPMHKMIKFESYEEAFGKSPASSGFAGSKYIFDLSTKLS